MLSQGLSWPELVLAVIMIVWWSGDLPKFFQLSSVNTIEGKMCQGAARASCYQGQRDLRGLAGLTVASPAPSTASELRSRAGTEYVVSPDSRSSDLDQANSW